MSKWGICLISLFTLQCCVVRCQSSDNGGIKTQVISNAEVGKIYSDFSVNSTIEYLFQFRSLQFKTQGLNNKSRPARVTVECLDATRALPVLVVLRQAKGVLSWQLPLIVPTKHDKVEYHRTSRTLCPNSNYQRAALYNGGPFNSFSSEIGEEVDIIISSSSSQNLTFMLKLELENDFVVSGVNDGRNLTVSPSEPTFYEFNWAPQSLDTVILRVDSDDNVCMVVSIQNISCPVFDLERTVQFEGYRQTVTSRGGITLTRSLFPLGFYIVFVVKGDDYDCTGVSSQEPTQRSKRVAFSLHPSIGYEEYVTATVSALSIYLAIYVIALLVSVAYFFKKQNNPDFFNFINDTTSSQAGPPDLDASTSGGNIQPYCRRCHRGLDTTSDTTIAPDCVSMDSSLDETDIDTLDDANYDKDVIRSKKILYVCDLARKNPKILRKKSLMYFWNLLTVATFYALPVVQLVLSSQMVLQQTGNQDLCYYNFLCSYPLGFLSDFNHVFSNIGYFLLGLLFVILVYRRDIMHCKAAAEIRDLDRSFGIPQHYGLLYAMGAALMMEGILSGCYHVCPNHSNFQFDTSFMYVISLLCMLKIYHTRHPDINASAYATFGVLALVILVGVAGILSGTTYFWAAFTVLHVLTCMWLSGKIYYMGRLRFGFSMFRRAYNLCIQEIIPNPCAFFKPRYPSRLVLLILGNMANWGLAALVWIYHLDSSFGSYLLAIFMANLMLYTIFYIVMKFLCGEKLLLQPAAYLILATLGWGSSLYFFFHKSISWAVTPAQSRSFNQPCQVMNFYDKHDIWHFLSAFSMFFSFMTLLTLDDDLVHVSRSKIPVF
ncbi:SID1 transmembrane family member 1-like [Thrips palmi]|uniref:SID1 transmembrane family member 1-like n=1 Tax=Thrips palmi TaxID=161013 RepID=A0A6P8ZRQ0_THRPL|nr:SID1 transmembrane family member 1-like [Thrips palmi]